MLPFTVDFRPGEPVSEQVIYAVKKAVATGQLAPGGRFPSVRTLSQALRINPNTAHKVVAALTADGVLTVHPGIGTVVAPPAAGTAQDRTDLLNHELERLVVEARRLGLDEDRILAAVRKHWRKFPQKT
jgi:GntR family transcriptional regulator